MGTTGYQTFSLVLGLTEWQPRHFGANFLLACAMRLVGRGVELASCAVLLLVKCQVRGEAGKEELVISWQGFFQSPEQLLSFLADGGSIDNSPPLGCTFICYFKTCECMLCEY